MHSSDLVSSFAEIAREKGIERDLLQLIVEDVFRAMIRKRYGADEAFEIIFNPDHGDIQILHIREVVPNMDLEDPVTQIEAKDAVLIDEDFGVGDEVASEVNVTNFGRRAVMTARQTFSQRIRDIEKENVFIRYSDFIGEVVVGEVYQTRRREVLVIHDKVELVLPREEQIYKDRYRKGDMLRAVIKEVRRDAGNNPQVIISRAAPLFMERLFELEVPEIDEGIVEIKKIVREPGDRAKVAVVSHDERIDAVGACVGMKGSRIHAVVRELGNENIDVLQWSDDSHDLIKRALAPANPVSVITNDELDPPRAKVVVDSEEVSKAIGRGGINIRLASALTGYEIDVYREISDEEEDIEIGEFGDELPQEILQKLRDIGCDSAKAVLELSVEELARRTLMDIEVASRVIAVIKAEFDEDEEEDDLFAATAAATAAASTDTVAPDDATETTTDEEEVADVESAARAADADADDEKAEDDTATDTDDVVVDEVAEEATEEESGEEQEEQKVEG
ncbi:MAG: transcription termination/antitermination protein NusA [Rhodothermales bacterium]|nr:transcription termination/antitermination protein NusA [Rhodothermales bacterium]